MSNEHERREKISSEKEEKPKTKVEKRPEKEKEKPISEWGIRSVKQRLDGIREQIRELKEPLSKKDEKELLKEIHKLNARNAELIREARRRGFLKDLDENVKRLAELSKRGQVLTRDLFLEQQASIRDVEDTPEHLEGVRQEYYRGKIREVLARKMPPEDLRGQRDWFREKLKVLRTLRLAPELITNHPTWIELTTAVPFALPELQYEFKSRLEILRYAMGFRSADTLENAIVGNSRLLVPYLGKALEVEEIGQAFDLLEKNSQITKEDIIERKQKEGIRLTAKEVEESLFEENILFAGGKKDREKILGNMALQLAESLGEETERLSKEKIKELKEKYRWAVEEAEDVWRILFRADENSVGLIAKGGHFYFNRLFHYASRMKDKGFGHFSLNKYFNRPFLPAQIERGKAWEVERKYPEQKEGEGRGLMVQGCLEFLMEKFGAKKLEEREEEGGLGFQKEVLTQRDGEGNEMKVWRLKKGEMIVDFAVYVDRKEEKRVEKAGTVINVANPDAKTLAQIFNTLPEGFYGSYIGGIIIPAEKTRKTLENEKEKEGPLAFPLGSLEEDKKRVGALKGELFGHLTPIAEHEGKRRPGIYYREDAWGDLLRGSIDFGLHEGKKMFEQWEIWGARNADVLLKAAEELKVIDKTEEDEVTGELLSLPFLRGHAGRWLRSNFDLWTMPYRWGPMRAATIAEVIKRFLKGLLEGTPFEIK